MGRDTHSAGGFRHGLTRLLKQLLLLLLAFIAGAAAMHLGMHADDAQRLQDVRAQLAAEQAQLQQAQADLGAAQTLTGVQQGTQKALQDKIAEQESQLAQVRDQLAFYEQLIPSGPAGSVAIRAFDVQPAGEFLNYRVLLSRNAPAGAAPFNGHMRFVAQGQSGGKTVKMTLEPPQHASSDAGSAAPSDPLALVFDQFQRSTGVLKVPAGLKPRSVRLEILDGDVVRVTRDATVASEPAPQ